MNSRLDIGTCILASILVLSACANASPDQLQTQAGHVGAVTFTPTNTPEPVPGTSIPSSISEVVPLATSRGPNLEATDPSKVNLASGQLQLVEFFRFT